MTFLQRRLQLFFLNPNHPCTLLFPVLSQSALCSLLEPLRQVLKAPHWFGDSMAEIWCLAWVPATGVREYLPTASWVA